MKIGLNMIMKNEAKVLPRFLASVAPLIDWYTIVDTGSTDNSKQIVKEFFDAAGIPGEIHDHPWENFEVNRNYALDKLKGHADFGFIIDADEVLTLPENFNKDFFKKLISSVDSAQLTCVQKGSEWKRLAFFRTTKPFRWKYPIHNVLLCPDDIRTINIGKEFAHLHIHTDGHSWTSQDVRAKYKKHAQILMDYIEKNGEDPRSVFYTAQCLKDAGEYEQAIEWYQSRLTMKNGFYEELYYSQLMIAQCKWNLVKPVSEVADEFMRCAEFDTLRCEHLYSLKKMYERNKRLHSALHIADALKKYEGKNPYPKRLLFLNNAAYKKPITQDMIDQARERIEAITKKKIK